MISLFESFKSQLLIMRHHDLQTLVLGRADKRIPFPFPLANAVPLFGTRLEPHVCECPFPGIVTRGTR